VEQNDAKNLPGGAGTKAAKFIKSMNPTHAVVGHLGPNAFAELSKSDIKIQLLKHKTEINIKQAFEEFLKGNLLDMTAPTVDPQHGIDFPESKLGNTEKK
jgi:predicted Fe-Mo cluster-binding NifX family protein